jgi:AraC family transcriptional regulator, arabinose operon regulatory protein
MDRDDFAIDASESPTESQDGFLRDDGYGSAAPIVTGDLLGGARYGVWRTRGTRDYLLMYTRSGRGRIGLGGGREQFLEAGQVVLLRPGTLHDYGTARGGESAHWNLLWAHFLPRPHWLDWLTWPELAPGVLHLALDEAMAPRVEASLLTMHRRATGALLQREEFALNALEEALLWCASENPATRRHDPRVAEALAFLVANLSRPITLDDVAKAAGLSISRLAHLVRQETGLTTLQFLERERLARARQLLRLTTRSVSEIAAEVGFENPNYFSLRFRKLVGVGPRRYRQQRNLTET